MKGEYVEDQAESQQSHPPNPHNMFPKFPPPRHHHQHQHEHPKFHPTHFPPHSVALAPKDSEEADSGASLQTTASAAAAATPTPSSSKKPKTMAAGGTEDGGTIEVVRRPRGRPPGSKNRPKPPVVITREPEPAMAPYILELPGGSDIVDSLTRFTRRRGIGLCVLTASGAVTNITLKQPSTAAPGGTVMFHGRFDILSLSAVLLNAAPFGGSSGNNNNGTFTFTISLAGPQGQIVGGKVVGPLLSSGTVYVIAASFNCPTFTKLPIDDQDAQNQATAGGGGGGGGDGQSSSPVSGDGGGGSGGPMGFYGCQLGSSSDDVIWTTTARPPPSHY